MKRESQKLTQFVVSLDACDYAAHIRNDANAAIAGIERFRQIFRELTDSHNGRTIDMVGDSMLACFDTPDAAVYSAIAFQRNTRQTPMTKDFQSGQPILLFRIGLSGGELQRQNDITFGNAINRAARLCALAAPGEVCIDAALYSDLATTLTPFQPRYVSGVPKAEALPIRGVALSVTHPTGAVDTTASEHARGEPTKVTVAGPVTEPFASRRSAMSGHQLPHGERRRNRLATAERTRGLATVVLVPTACEQSAARDRLLFALIDRLVGRSFHVEVGPTEVGMDAFLSKMTACNMEMGDYFVSLGDSGAAKSALALSVYSTRERRFLLSRQYDEKFVSRLGRSLGGVGSHIAETIEAAEVQASARHTHKPRGAFQLLLEATRSLRSMHREDVMYAIQRLEDAMRVDPQFARAHAMYARAQAIAWRFQWGEDDEDHLETAVEHAQRAVQIDPVDPVCEAQLGFVAFWAREHGRAIHCFERSVQMDPGNSDTISDLGMAYSYLGRSDEAIPLLQQSLEQDPSSPDDRLWSLGDAGFASGDYFLAIEALAAMRDQTQSQRLMAACKVRLGEDPSPHVRRMLKTQPDFSISTWMQVQPLAHQGDVEDYADALRQAGFPH